MRRRMVSILCLAILSAACTRLALERQQDETTTTAADLVMVEESTAPIDPPGETVRVDGVSATDSTINVGVLADLTGPFSSGVVDVLDAQLAFWADLNEQGGIDGRSIEVMVEDTGYDTTRHLRGYHRLVDQVVMFSHSTGTEQTAAISDLLSADDRVAVPLTWYSAWSSDRMGANLVEIGSNYCIEAVNTLAYLRGRSSDGVRIAVVTVPGDFGADSAGGLSRAAEALGVDIVYDGTGTLAPGADLTEVARAIASTGPDWVWLSADPSVAIQLVAIASQFGYDGGWTGSSPTWNTRLLATQLGPMLGDSVLVPSLVAPLGASVEGMDTVERVLAERLPDRYPSEALVVGYLEFEASRRLLQAAADAGDLTPAGVERVASNVVGSGFDGISPAAEHGDLVTATGVSRFSYATFADQGGLDATLEQGALSPLESVAAFDTYGAHASLDYSETCPAIDASAG